jgi:hypothetical protein
MLYTMLGSYTMSGVHIATFKRSLRNVDLELLDRMHEVHSATRQRA